MKPADKNSEIRAFQSAMLGLNVEACIMTNTCVICKGDASEFDDCISEKEFTLSGMCQSCQDKVFNNDGDAEAWSLDDDD